MPPTLSTTPSPAQPTAPRPPKRRRAAEPPSQSQSRPALVLSSLIPSPPRSSPTTDRLVKRRRTERGASGPGTQSSAERRSEDAASGAAHPPGFWDNLSRIPLARSALTELDRRNGHAAPAITAKPALATHPPGVDISRFAKHGGPDLSDLHGFQPMPPGQGRQNRRGRGAVQKLRARPGGSSRSGSRSGSRRTGQTTSSSPYDAVFKQHLIDGKVWPINHYLETGLPDAPGNLEEITQRICAGRASLEPELATDEAYRSFHKAYSIAASEEAQSRTLDTIEGALSLSSLHIKRGPVKVVNLRPLLPYNLVPGNPDRVWGARPEALHIAVRTHLQDLILPTAAQDIACPNFVVHVKGPTGSHEVAKLQAVYDGALAARGMEALWAYGCDREGDVDGGQNQARTISCTFVDGVLRLYAVHCYSRISHRPGEILLRQSDTSTDIEYVTTLIRTFPVLDRAEDFRQGAAALRHGLEWAREQRDRAIERANRRHLSGDGRPGSSGSEYQSPVDPPPKQQTLN